MSALARHATRLLTAALLTTGLAACGGALGEDTTDTSTGSSSCTSVDTSKDYVQTYLGSSYSTAMSNNSGNSTFTTMLQLVDRKSTRLNSSH